MKIVHSVLQKAILLFAFLFCISNMLNAATCTFTNGGGDNLWSNANNWDTATVPGVGDDVIVSTLALNINQNISVNSFTISSGANVNFNHPGIAYIGALAISGGSLSSVNKIIVTNSFNWTGTSSITPSSTLELSVASISTISGSGNRNLYGQLVNYGTCTHTGGSLRFQTGGSINNYGTYTIDGADFIINTGGGAFTNHGVFNKNNTNTLNLFVALDQMGSGQLNINQGTLSILSGGSHVGSATINIANGAILNISSGTYDLTSGTSTNGAGDVHFNGGVSTFDGTFNLTGETKILGGTINFNHTSPTIFTNLMLSGGTLQGSSQLVVNNSFKWTGTSSIKSTDSIKMAGTATGLIYTGGSKNLYTPFINNASISHTDGNLRFYPGGSLENNGTYILNGPTAIYDDGGGSFENNGAFEHQEISILNIYPDFNNNIIGSVKGIGNIEFSNLTNLGAFIADAASGTLNLTGTFDNGNKLEIGFDNADHGEVVVSGDITLSGDLDVTLIGSVPPGTYKILSTTSGTISGTFDNENIPAEFSVTNSVTEVNLMVSLLPLELTEFKVFAKRNDVLLQWQTASELNSESFLIEHSPDANNFYPVGEVKAAGISNTIQNYQFVHESPINGTNYYRLRQQDIDGHFEYSDLRVLHFYNFKKEISIYPNPTMGQITIKNFGEKEFKMTLTDLSGKVIYSRAGIAPGETILDLESLPKSMYTLEVFDYLFSHKEKVMILE